VRLHPAQRVAYLGRSVRIIAPICVERPPVQRGSHTQPVWFPAASLHQRNSDRSQRFADTAPVGSCRSRPFHIHIVTGKPVPTNMGVQPRRDLMKPRYRLERAAGSAPPPALEPARTVALGSDAWTIWAHTRHRGTAGPMSSICLRGEPGKARNGGQPSHRSGRHSGSRAVSDLVRWLILATST
jgi:hypothetical protein